MRNKKRIMTPAMLNHIIKHLTENNRVASLVYMLCVQHTLLIPPYHPHRNNVTEPTYTVSMIDIVLRDVSTWDITLCK